jgi:hypothetical protein
MRPLAVSFSWALALVSASVRADEPPVLLALDDCAELEESEVRRIVAAELGASAASRRGPDVTEVTIQCSGTRVFARVRDPLSRKEVRRSFDIGLSDPRARARLVALAASELVLASWAELEVNPSARVEPEGPAPSETTKRAAGDAVSTFLVRQHDAAPEADRERYEPRVQHWYDAEAAKDRKLRLVFLGSRRAFFGGQGTLTGGGVRLGEEHFRFVSWSTDLLFESGSVRGSAGEYSLETMTLGGWLLAYYRMGVATARLGAGLRAGFVGSSARAPARAQGSATLVPWGWPLGAVSCSLQVLPMLLVEVSAEAGYVVLPVPDPSEPAFRGGWFSGQLGLGTFL